MRICKRTVIFWPDGAWIHITGVSFLHKKEKKNCCYGLHRVNLVNVLMLSSFWSF